ncbi:MAG: hypothetical protein KAR06_04230 [Deltaproteobacteria bacterium]|nr:hypothetical protein [Deltaproteobacteria bacterium]
MEGKVLTPKEIEELINMAISEAYERGKREALESGVVGEMVEVMKLFKEYNDAECGVEWPVFEPKIQSILAKLEGNDG